MVGEMERKSSSYYKEYQYEARDDEDCEFKAILWPDLEDTFVEQLNHKFYFGNFIDEKVLLYRVSHRFMYKCGRSGRLVKHRGIDVDDFSYFMGPPPSAYDVGDDIRRTKLGMGMGRRMVSNIGQGNATNLPIGMYNYLHAWILEEKAVEAMCRDISNFARQTFQSAHADPDLAARNVIIVQVRLLIITVQRKGEKLTGTRDRCVSSTTLPRVDKFLSLSEAHEHGLPSIYQNEHYYFVGEEDELKDDDCCCICLKELICSPPSACRLRCTHIFHYHCIAKWLWMSNRCPLCRAAYRRFITEEDQFDPLMPCRLPQ